MSGTAIDASDPDASPLVRTHFGDDVAWERLLVDAQRPYAYGFLARFNPVIADRAYEGADAQALAAADGDASLLFVADERSMTSDDPTLLVVDRDEQPGRSFRCELPQLWSVENNLRIANMDWEDFAEEVDADGVHRGFPA